MGFFSELLGVVAPIAGAFLGLPAAPVAAAPAAVAPTLLAAPTQLAAISAPPSATPLLVAGTRGQMISPSTREALFKAAGSPTGGLRKRTIIETFDPGSGFVTKRRIHDGGVAVFSADVAAALMAGLIIVPASVAFGVQLESGPALMFDVLPRIFDRMQVGESIHCSLNFARF